MKTNYFCFSSVSHFDIKSSSNTVHLTFKELLKSQSDSLNIPMVCTNSSCAHSSQSRLKVAVTDGLKLYVESETAYA